MKKCLPLLLALALACAAASRAHALIISYSFDGSTYWTDAAKLVVKDAVAEWEAIYCPEITIEVKFTWHDFVDKDGNPSYDWGVTRNGAEQWNDTYKKYLPKSADVELNSRIASQYWWDPTPWDITDDEAFRKGQSANDSIDAASVLKHELMHAIGFWYFYTEYRNKVKTQDLDGDGKKERLFIDCNNNNTYDTRELVLYAYKDKDGNYQYDPNHTDDGFYKPTEPSLMGRPGFGFYQQARPSWLEIQSLNHIYGYPVHIPEPSSLTVWGLLAVGAVLAARRRS